MLFTTSQTFRPNRRKPKLTKPLTYLKMWILPKPLHTLPSVSDTEGLISDLKEQSEMCAQSLFRKSSLSPARTWLASWKRDSWSALLYGRILKPSHGKSFTEELTSCPGVFPASRFPLQGSVQEMKIQDTYSPTSSMDSSDLDSQDLFSLKMWKESLVPNSQETTGETRPAPRFCSMSLESWKGWVTQQRQQWSQRQSVVLRIAAKGSSSSESVGTWPTAQTSDANGAASPDRDAHRVQLRDVETGLGACLVTTQNGSTETTHGQADQGNVNTHGNHQGSLEQSQRNWQTFAPGTHDRGAIPHRQMVKCLVTGEKAKTQCLTVDQVFAEEIKGTNPSWSTPTAMDSSEMSPELRPSRIATGRTTDYLARQVQWSTPRASGSEENIETWKARMDRLPESYSMPLAVQIQEYPTPRTTDYKSSPNAPSNADRVENGLATLGEFIHDSQKVPKIKSTAKLNPRWVETLMGLPIGWVNPLCTNPIAIVDRNSECSETELSPSLVKSPSESSSVGSAKTEWSTPTTTMAPETVDPKTFNGKFFKKPDGRKHQTDLQLQAQMHGNGDPKSWPTPTLSDEESLDTWAARRDRKAEQGINLHKPLSIAVRQELGVDETQADC